MPTLTRVQFDALSLSQKEEMLKDVIITVDYHFLRHWGWFDALEWRDSTEYQAGMESREQAVSHGAYAIVCGAVKPLAEPQAYWARRRTGEVEEAAQEIVRQKAWVKGAITGLQERGYTITPPPESP